MIASAALVSRGQTAFFFCVWVGFFPTQTQKKKSGLATRDYRSLLCVLGTVQCIYFLNLCSYTLSGLQSHSQGNRRCALQY